MSAAPWRIRNPFLFLCGLACAQLGLGILLYQLIQSNWKHWEDSSNAAYLMAYISYNVVSVALVGFMARRWVSKSPSFASSRQGTITWILFAVGYVILVGLSWLYFIYGDPRTSNPIIGGVGMLIVGFVLLFAGWRMKD
ncbi:MAG: hypothetical protein HY291_04840 [Planctomycetes bacterium]|nr:hypothetical protein [Planctomycetota bacterium]